MYKFLALTVFRIGGNSHVYIGPKVWQTTIFRSIILQRGTERNLEIDIDRSGKSMLMFTNVKLTLYPLLLDGTKPRTKAGNLCLK